MWFRMKKVGVEFVDEAKKKYIVEKETTLPIETVWNAFVSPETWSDWFPGVESASYGNDQPPYGVGTFRESKVNGFLWHETICVWEEYKRWGYSIDKATFPVSYAQVEVTEFEKTARGTKVRWIMALNPRFYMRIPTKLLPREMEKLLTSALKNLELLNKP
jgi:uncharacterized protein YndB with AHSA1/START domain